MTTFAQVERLHRRLMSERRRVVDAAAAVDALPPKGLLARLCELDGAIEAVDRLTHHCDIVETGNESWRFKNRA